MKVPDQIREPIPTIPDEPMTRPSGFRTLAADAKPIPDEIRKMVRKMVRSEGNVDVRKIIDDSVVIKDRFEMMPGGLTPIVYVSRVVFTDGETTSLSSAQKVPKPEDVIPSDNSQKKRGSVKITHSVTRKIDGANYIAVVHHTNSREEREILAMNSLEVFAREPRVVYDFLETIRNESDEPSK